MKKKVGVILLVTFFLFFIGVIDYPFVSRLYNEWIQGRVVMQYDETASGLDTEACEKQKQIARAYNESLFSGNRAGIQDAFQGDVDANEEYQSILNPDRDGVMAIVEIPKVHLSIPVYHGTSEATLQKGAGHLEGSSIPIGGENTHTCISAHRGLPQNKLFTNLDQLEEGDQFYIRVLGEVLAYKVTAVETVTPDRVEALHIQPGEDLATLITCTPYGINTHRLYVHGVRTPYVEEDRKESGELTVQSFFQQYWWILLTLLLLLWMILLVRRIQKSK